MNTSHKSAPQGPGESAGSPGERLPTTVPLNSVDHGNASTRGGHHSTHASRAGSKANSPSKTVSPSHHSKAGSPADSTADSPSHDSRSNNASAFFSPPMKGELVETGVMPGGRRSAAGGGGAAAALQQPPGVAEGRSILVAAVGGRGGGAASNANSPNKAAANARSAPDVAVNKRGRRGEERGNANWFEHDRANRLADTELNRNVATLNDGVTDQEMARREQEQRAQRQQEQLAQHISDPPTGYQATLPRLSELDVTNSWDKLLRMMRNEYDVSCLTNCLARELDEDVAWNPEMLLVQLTSDLMDVAELEKENEMYFPVDDSDIGQMTGGEVVRRRGEKPQQQAQQAQPPVHPNGASPAPPSVGVAFGGAAAAPGPQAGKAPPLKTSRSARNLKAGGGLTATIVEPESPAKKASSKRKGTAPSPNNTSVGGTSTKGEKPQSTKKSSVKSMLKL